MRRFRRLRFAAGPKLRWVVLLLAIAFLLLRLADLLLMVPLGAVAQVEAHHRAAGAVNRVVADQVGQSLRHSDLVTYEKDQGGRIAAYRINTPLLNQVAAEAAKSVQGEIERMASEPIAIPLGVLTGSTLLAGFGPRLSVKLVPKGTVAIDFRQEFQGEGINQTRHRIWLRAHAAVRVVLPFRGEEVDVTQEFPLSETVIVGPVPDSFYGAGALKGVTLPLGQ